MNHDSVRYPMFVPPADVLNAYTTVISEEFEDEIRVLVLVYAPVDTQTRECV
jgi:hypothetical protein